MVPVRLIKLVMALYENSTSKVKAPAGISEEFSIRVGCLSGISTQPTAIYSGDAGGYERS